MFPTGILSKRRTILCPMESLSDIDVTQFLAPSLSYLAQFSQKFANPLFRCVFVAWQVNIVVCQCHDRIPYAEVLGKEKLQLLPTAFIVIKLHGGRGCFGSCPSTSFFLATVWNGTDNLNMEQASSDMLYRFHLSPRITRHI